jgi:hypothetical protein
MYCPECGYKIAVEDAKFCHKCGYGLSKVSENKPIETNNVNNSAGKDHRAKNLSVDQTQKPQDETRPSAAGKTEQVPPDARKEIALPAGKKDKWKWGWGWYILLGIVYISIRKEYSKYGEYESFLQVFSIALSIFIYYLFRRRVLKGVKVLWQRSLYSGLIAFLVGAILIPAAAVFVPTQRVRLAHEILAEAKVLQSHTQEFVKNDRELWTSFVSQPTSEKDFRNNLLLIEAAIPMYQKKDSTLVTVLRKIYGVLRNHYAETDSANWPLSFTPNDFQKLVKKAEDISETDQIMLSNLRLYYNSLISSSDLAEKYLSAYQSAQQQLNATAEEYAALYKQFLAGVFAKDERESKE